jgi:hypothetical protein
VAEFHVDRRALLTAGAAACAVPLASSAAVFTAGGLPWLANQSSFPTATDLKAHYVYFTGDEAAFVEAACARMIPAVATYVRNSWGNAAPAVSASDVARLRRRVGKPVQKPSATI